MVCCWSIPCELSCAEHIFHIRNKCIVYTFLLQKSRDVVFVQVCCRDGQTVTEISPSSTFDLGVESIFVICFQRCARCFKTSLGNLVCVFVSNAREVSILLNPFT